MRGKIIRMEDWKRENTVELESLKKEYIQQEMSEEQLEKLQATMNKAKMENKRERAHKQFVRYAATAAVVVATFVILPNTSVTVAHAMEQIPFIGQFVEVVTFRNYEYEDGRHKADIDVPELVVDSEVQDEELQEKLEKTTEEVNAEIQRISEELIADFEKYAEDEMGYQEILVTSEVLATTQNYFTLKILCYQGAGSGYQWNYYYTVDLNTGERLKMKDIFVEGADYITPISESIKEQMREQMAADEKVSYWLDEEIEEWNFKTITNETSFYLNEKGNLVIGFDEGEVGPMYMGAVEFEIPAESLSEIRK